MNYGFQGSEGFFSFLLTFRDLGLISSPGAEMSSSYNKNNGGQQTGQSWITIATQENETRSEVDGPPIEWSS